MADERSVADADQDDDDDTSSAGIIRRMDKVTRIVQRANARLDRIDPNLTAPPDPDRPALIKSLTLVQGEAQKLATHAGALATRLSSR